MTTSAALRRVIASAMIAGSALCITACSNTVSLEPAADANNPLCAALTVSLPQSVSSEERRWTDAQATGAWGNPASILLTCGVQPPGPSTLPCYELGGIDWLAQEQEENIQRAVAFGRDPAVEVVVSRDTGIDFATVLDELGQKIALAVPEQTATCTERAPTPE